MLHALLEPPEGSDAPAIFACEVDMETPRGRPLGSAQSYLVDIPNELIGKFCSALGAYQHPSVHCRRRHGQTSQNICIHQSRRLDRWRDGPRHCTRLSDWRGISRVGGSAARWFYGRCAGFATTHSRAGRFGATSAVSASERCSKWSERGGSFKSPSVVPAKSISGFVSCRLGAIAKISWKSSTKGGLRRTTQGSFRRSCDRTRKFVCSSGSQSRGRAAGGLGDCCSSDGGPHAADDVGAIEAKSDPPFSSGQSEVSRSRLRSSGWWRRRKFEQQLGGQGNAGTGCLHQGHSGSFKSGCDWAAECTTRAGVRRFEAGQFIDEAVCGTPHAPCREPTVGVSCIHASRSMGGGVQFIEQGTSGLSVQDAHFYRADGFGWGKNGSFLAFDGSAGPSIPFTGEQSSEARPSAFHKAGESFVGFGESCIRERSRCSGKQDADNEQGRQDEGSDRGRRRRFPKEAGTEETTYKAKGRRQRRCRAEFKREHHGLASPSSFPDQHSCLSSGECSSANFSKKAERSCDKPVSSDKADCDLRLPDLSDLQRVFNPIKLVQGMINQFWDCPSALTAFARQSLKEADCNMHTEVSSSLWPVPPVRWSWTAASRLGPRRRRRRHYFRIRHELLQLVLISLNWETMGFVSKPPKEATLGFPLSAQQHAIVERVESMLDHFLHVDCFGPDDLGRSGERFLSVINLIQSFPKCKLDVEVLEKSFMQVHEHLGPYRDRTEPFCSPSTVDVPNHTCDSVRGRTAKTTSVSAKPVIADRVKWSYPPSFDAQEFLNPVVRAAYNDPEVLRKPPSEWPPAHPARMHISKAEFLKLVDKWDALGACMLLDSSEVDWDEAVGIFCVPKDSQFDRLIINPKTINGRMDTITESTKELAPGCMLGLLHLEGDEVFRFQADDLSDFYYTFRVPEKRALRNIFRLELHWTDIAHLKCAHESLKHKKVAVALRTLAMGDSLAVEIAQQAHSNILKQPCGAMIHEETLKYRSPVPRGDFIELLAIDDHVGIQRLKRSDLGCQPWLRDNDVFSASQVAYSKVGLIQQEKKRKRNQTKGVILGADFDGVAGKVMAPRNRIAILSLLTFAVARGGGFALVSFFR